MWHERSTKDATRRGDAATFDPNYAHTITTEVDKGCGVSREAGSSSVLKGNPDNPPRRDP